MKKALKSNIRRDINISCTCTKESKCQVNTSSNPGEIINSIK